MEIISKAARKAKARLFDGEFISPALASCSNSDRWYPPRKPITGLDYLHRGMVLNQVQRMPELEDIGPLNQISLRGKIGLAIGAVAYATIVLTEAYFIRGR